MAGGVDVSATTTCRITPDYTATVRRAVESRAITSAISGFGRGEVVLSGAFQYDEANTRRPGGVFAASTSAPARAASTCSRELWVRNAFETRYVPIAIPYPGFAPSGFIGENGRPRTFGVSVGVTF